MRQAEYFIQANQYLNGMVARIGDRWQETVPAAPAWTVHDLVNHVTINNLALAAWLEGKEAVEADDVLGLDAQGAWTDSAERAEKLAADCIDGEREVVTPLGTLTIADTLLLQTTDRLVHGWDLSGALDTDVAMPPALAQAAYDFIIVHADALRAAEAFGPEAAVRPGAGVVDKLLAVTGRDSGYRPAQPDDEPKAQEIHRS